MKICRGNLQPTSRRTKKIEVEADAWDRFERAVDVAIKSGPKHRTKEEGALSRPARPGDTLAVHGEVTEVKPSRSRPDRGTISISAETRNQRDEVLQILTATLLVPR